MGTDRRFEFNLEADLNQQVKEARAFHRERYDRWSNLASLRKQCARLAAERDLEYARRVQKEFSIEPESEPDTVTVEPVPAPKQPVYVAVSEGGNVYFRRYVNGSGGSGWAFTSSRAEAYRASTASDLMNALHLRGATAVHHWQIEREVEGQPSEIIGIYPPLREGI